MRKIELLEVRQPNKPARFYADGKRVSHRQFDYLELVAIRLDTFHSKAKELPGGEFKRYNYKTATLEA